MWMLLAITAVTFLVGVPFLLWWWRMADMWVKAEHRRFADKPELDTPRVVVRTYTDSRAESQRPPHASNPDPSIQSTPAHDDPTRQPTQHDPDARRNP